MCSNLRTMNYDPNEAQLYFFWNPSKETILVTETSNPLVNKCAAHA